ncbi:MAG: hypothetical protein JXQ29_04490 [Planctomycetes bacterium]|nr:hypothetical protein [Planctomycetota bacterium]
MHLVRGFLLAAAVALGGGCACLGALFCPAPPPPLLGELDWSTPAAAVETYRRAFRAENAHYEYLCLSDQLKREHPVSLAEYHLGRDRFLAANRELVDLFLEAETGATAPVPGTTPPQVVIRLRKGPHFADFRLVNEPVVWVWWEDLETGDIIPVEVPVADIATLIRVRDRTFTVAFEVPPTQEMPPATSIQKITATDRWRLLNIDSVSSSLRKALAESAATGDPQEEDQEQAR